MNSNALIIIAKSPDKDNVKTRLKGFMTDDERVKLYEILLYRTMAKLRKIPGTDTFTAFAPADAVDYFTQFGTGLIPLDAADLGTGMYAAFKEVFGSGYRKAALVGADIPELSASIILDAFDALSVNDLVFGPAEDGGYYLIGMKKLIRDVFENVPWSSGRTLKASLLQAERSGHSTGFTKILNDIDTIEDIRKAGFIF